MATIEKLQKGQADWDVTVNQLIDKYEELQEETPVVTDWTNEGVVLLNGTTWSKSTRGYRIMQFKHAKIVQLDLKFTCPSAKDRDFQVATLPDSIAFGEGWMEAGSSTYPGMQGYAIFVLADNNIRQTLISPNAVPSNGWGPGGACVATYLIKD